MRDFFMHAGMKKSSLATSNLQHGQPMTQDDLGGLLVMNQAPSEIEMDKEDNIVNFEQGERKQNILVHLL